MVQEGLFDKADNPRCVALMRTIDRLNAEPLLRPRYGVLRCHGLPATMEAAPGVSVALLHDRVG
jgi:hypothetical protein